MCMYAFVSIHDCIQIFVPWLLCIKLCSVTQQGIIDIKLTTSISFGFSGRPQLITILYLLCIYMFLCILCTYWNKILSYHMVLCHMYTKYEGNGWTDLTLSSGHEKSHLWPMWPWPWPLDLKTYIPDAFHTRASVPDGQPLGHEQSVTPSFRHAFGVFKCKLTLKVKVDHTHFQYQTEGSKDTPSVQIWYM